MSTLAKSSKYAWWVAFAGFLTQVLCCWTVAIWGMNMALIANDFAVQPADLAIGASLGGALYAGSSFFWGNLADRIGVRKVMGIAGMACGVFVVLTGMLPNGVGAIIALYSIACFLLGSIGNGVTPKLVSTWFAAKARGKGFMLCIIGGSIGGMTIGLVAPVFIGIGGWRLCFEIMGCIGIVFCLFAFIIMRDNPASIGALPFGADQEEAIEQQAIVVNDAKGASNADRFKRVLKMPITYVMALVVILFQLWYTGHQTYFVVSLMGHGYDVTVAGLGSSIVMAGCCIGYLIFSPLSDKVPRKFVLGGLCVGAGVFYIVIWALLNQYASIYLVLVISFFAGVCMGAFALLQSVQSELYSPDLRGAGPGVVSTFGLIGKFFGPLLAAACVGLFGYDWGYMTVAAACAIGAGVIALVFLPKTSGKYGDPAAEKYFAEKKAAEELAAQQEPVS